jgi:predicted transcriptional regulator
MGACNRIRDKGLKKEGEQMRKNTMTEFGKWVKKSLLEIGMTQRSLSEEVGIDERFLSNILYGIRPGHDYIDKIKSVIESKKKKLSKTA